MADKPIRFTHHFTSEKGAARYTAIMVLGLEEEDDISDNPEAMALFNALYGQVELEYEFDPKTRKVKLIGLAKG